LRVSWQWELGMVHRVADHPIERRQRANPPGPGRRTVGHPDRDRSSRRHHRLVAAHRRRVRLGPPLPPEEEAPAAPSRTGYQRGHHRIPATRREIQQNELGLVLQKGLRHKRRRKQHLQHRRQRLQVSAQQHHHHSAAAGTGRHDRRNPQEKYLP
jgi:hypothetical protein